MELGEELRDYEQEIKFKLGYAGSGKSTHLASKLADDSNYMVLTPTHKAKEVLNNKGMINVFTIYSVLKLVPNIDDNFRGKMRTKLLRIGELDMSTVKKIYIDEFSMIPKHVFDILLEILPATAEVIVYGDPYQLPPVNGEAINPEDYIYTDSGIELFTNQYRSKAPNVVETFMRYVHYLKDSSCNDLKLYTNRGSDLVRMGNNWVSEFNPDTDKILAYTNKKVSELNIIVSEHLGLPLDTFNLDEELQLGSTYCKFDSIGHTDFNDNLFPSLLKGSNLVEDFEKKLKQVNTNIEKFRTDLSMYKKCVINFNDEFYNIYYDDNYHETDKNLKLDVEFIQNKLINHHNLDKSIKLAKWCKENRNEKFVSDRGRAWGKYLGFKNHVFRLDRKFASTVHKVQGSEFSNVFLAHDDIKTSVRNGNYTQFATLMYVALSRAIDRLIIIN